MVTIRRAGPDDYRRAATTYARAFEDDPVIRWLVPDDHEYAAIEQPFFGFLVRRWVAGGTLWCTDDVVAVAGWNAPGRPEIEFDRSEVELDHPQERLDKFEALGEHLTANTPEEPHWHLNMLGTHPDWQRQGLGAALMAEGFAIADEAALPCYLETETVGNVAYYRHHGFEVRSEWDLPLDGPHMWGMLRPTR